MGKLKLKWRIFAYLLCFCALLLISLWLFQTVFLTDMYKFIRKTEIDKAIALTAENIDNPDLYSLFREWEINNEIIVMPTQDFSAPPRSGGARDMPGRPRLETITQSEEFTTADGRVAAFTFYAIITPVDATISTLRAQLYAVTVIMLLFSVIIAAAISRRISKPIEDINSGAKLLARGEYNTHFNGTGFLEIKELSDTLNTASVELAKAENLRRELMANVSHDLRTPLALIYSYAELMNDFPDEITPQHSQTIMDETRRLSSLVNDILDISQLETGNIGLRAAGYNLTESIAATIKRTTELIKPDSYEIIFINSENIYVYADEVKITQAFYNLLINAVNYGGIVKRIIVRQTVIDGYVKIDVSDFGDGISPENLPYVWDRYYKIDRKHKRPVAGTGLGLSIVKKIIEMHGGSYGVISEPGKGSTFWFQLAIANPGDVSAP